MKFGKNHKVLIDSMDKIEAEAYVVFLGNEIERHRDALRDIVYASKWDREYGSLFVGTEPYRQASRKFWNSAIRRHQEDIKDAEKLIETVKAKFEKGDYVEGKGS